MTRGVDDLLTDLAEAADAAAELVTLGKKRWDAERPLRLAGEAVIGRLGDIATKLPDEITKATPEIPWRQVKGIAAVASSLIVPNTCPNGPEHDRARANLARSGVMPGAAGVPDS